MRVKEGAAPHGQEAPSEQATGEDPKSQVLEFPSNVLCAGPTPARFLAGMGAETRNRLLDSINDRFQNDVTPILVGRMTSTR